MLRAGTLTLHDIVFRQGDPKWLRINEFTDLDFNKEIQTQNWSVFVDLPHEKTEKKTIETKETKPAGTLLQEWIVLVKIRNQGESKFVQQGPFSTDEIKNNIQSGQYRYNDFVWKKGFEKWERIGDLADFSFKGETQILSLASLAQLKFPEDSEDAPSIKIQKRKNVPQPEKRSQALDEFTKTAIATQKTTKKIIFEKTHGLTGAIKSQSVNYKPQINNQENSDSIEFDTAKTRTIIQRSTKKKRRQLNKAIQSGLLFVIGGGLIIILQGIVKNDTAEMPAEKPQELSSRAPSGAPPQRRPEVKKEIVKISTTETQVTLPAKEETKIAMPLPRPIVVRKGKAFVKFKTIDINGKNPKIVLSSNAAEDEPIRVKIKGATGELLGLPSFSWENNIRRKRGPEPEILLKGLGMSPGFYFMTAELAEATAETGKIFIGSKKDFSRKIEEHRKLISFRQQQEKKQLFRLLSDLTSQADVLFLRYKSSSNLSEFAQFLNGWRSKVQRISSDEFRSFGQRTRNNYAFPETWQEVKDMKERLLAEAKKLESSFDSSRKAAADVSMTVITEIQKLLQKIAELSGWKAKVL